MNNSNNTKKVIADSAFLFENHCCFDINGYNTFDHDSTYKIVAKGKYISGFSEDILLFKNVETAVFVNNLLTELKYFDNMTQLRNLVLDDNLFEHIQGLDQLKGLVMLSYKYNNLQEISNLEHNTKIEILDLEDNDIKVINNLGYNQSLKKLYIDANDHLTESIYHPKGDCWFDIYHQDVNFFIELEKFNKFRLLEIVDTYKNNPSMENRFTIFKYCKNFREDNLKLFEESSSFVKNYISGLNISLNIKDL